MPSMRSKVLTELLCAEGPSVRPAPGWYIIQQRKATSYSYENSYEHGGDSRLYSCSYSDVGRSYE
eukprot:scaffold62472_cov29-Prasinocladus_malaysianus.AAC.1